MTDPAGAPSREALLDALLKRAPLAVYAYGHDGVCTFATGAVYDAIGLDVSRLVGVDLFGRLAPDDQHLARLRRPLAGETVQFEYSDGGSTFELWLAPLYDDRGGVSGALGVGVDVTERVLAEHGRDLYQAFVSAAPQFIALVGLDGKVRYVNPGGRALAGISDDVVVTSTTIGDYLTPDGLRLSVDVEQPAVLARGSYAGESTLRHWPTGTGIPVHVDSFLLTQPGTGEPVALATVQTDIREVVAARRVLEDSVVRQRGLIVHMHEAQEAERRRLAADVHDDTLQVLAGANLRLQDVRRRAVESGATDLADDVDALDHEMREASGRLRRLLFELEPARHGGWPGDLGARLASYARATLAATGPPASIEVDPDLDPPPIVAQVLYRIAQQALANVAKHAAASAAQVRVTADGSMFVLTVTDDGQGLPRMPTPDANARGGLRGMVERAESAGGSCTVTPRPDGPGTRVTARIPARIGDIDASTHRSSARAFLEQTMESIGDGFAAIDNEWRYVYVNRLGEQALGRGPGEVIGRVIWEEFDVPPDTEQAYRRARETMEPATFESFYPKWGRWFQNSVYPSESGLSVFFRDITAQRHQQVAASEQQRVLKTAREVLSALRDEPDLRRALTRAIVVVRRDWGAAGVRVQVDDHAGRQVFDVSVGERASAEQYDVPLVHAGAPVGTVTVVGRSGAQKGARDGGAADDDLLLSLFALRIAAG